MIATLVASASAAAQTDETAQLEPLGVTPTRQAVPLSTLAGNASRVGGDVLALNTPTHPGELLWRVPGTWVTRGSGQEHLTAIRSPVLTGAGSCGAFLMAEDGLPIRPAGFCNVNQLFEINIAQAAAVEVTRGPGGAYFGSNALHGVINVLPPAARDYAGPAFGLEAGPDDYVRISLDVGTRLPVGTFRITANGSHDGGFRNDTGYEEEKLNLAFDNGDGFEFALAATNLRQESAGFVFGLDAYEDAGAVALNPNPEAYRDADAQRLSARWLVDVGGGLLELRPYARRSRMAFLQFFLPGQPLEENGQDSAGINATWRAGGDSAWSLGLDAEIVSGYLRETQARAIVDGSDFLRETRPAGKHYDYDVDALSLAPFVHAQWTLTDRVTLDAGVRFERLSYDYDNRMLAGNTRDDGSPCGFGGCLFNRPADRDDRFENLGAKTGLAWRVTDTTTLYGAVARGFRAPQATELYRLQRQQNVADLDSETLDSVEAGWRYADGGVSASAAAYAMRKRNFIFRDADGFNVSDGRTRHIGLEWDAAIRLGDGWTLSGNGAWSDQTYRFDRSAGGGETIVSGNEIDTAPRLQGAARLGWTYSPSGSVELEWLYLGNYYLDAANEHRYGGHRLVNLRLRHRVSQQFSLGVRLLNVADTAYAERADFAFGNYRYQPGRGRSLYLDFTWRP